MKTTFKSILLTTLGVFAFASCEDVPAPYQIPGTGEKPQTSSFYSSTSCSDWSMLAGTTGNNPWSQGSSYTQATGYQKWDGASAKSNKMADGYLISPSFSTVTEEETAYISFQYCVGYASNDAQFADHIKLYASTQYASADGFVAEKWTQLDWKATHTSTNWELATTTVTLPAEFVNKEKVNIAFYFTTPNATQSSTFEIKEFKAVAGKPDDSGEGGGGQTEGTPVTCAQAVELTNALQDGATSEDTYTITGYITEVVGSVSKGQQTFWMADTKDGGQVFEAYWANLPEGVEKFVKGSKVKITGQLMKYVNNSTGAVTPEIKNAKVEILEAGDGGQGGGGDIVEGTEVTCAQAVELTNALADGATSTETYTVTGYITEVIGNVSRNQQTFWMADTKDGGRIFEAYWADLPEGVTAFVKGSKVKITGQLMKYVNNSTGAVTPEIKNAKVEILEAGDGGQGEEPGGEQGGDTSEYGISLSYTGGTNFYDNGVATINGVADCKVLKIGTSKAAGDFTLSVPAGKHSFYAVTWKGTGTADVILKNGETVVETITVKENDGATQNSPYTFTVTEADKYEFEVATACTLTVTSDKRIIFFGIK